MFQEHKIDEELAALEAALANLELTASGIDRDRLMFEAGKASCGVSALPANHTGKQWLWPAATAVSLLLVLSFGGMFFFLGSPRVEKQIVYVNVDPTKTEANLPKKLWYDTVKGAPKTELSFPMQRTDGTDYFSLSRMVAANGADLRALPKSNSIPPNESRRRATPSYRYWEMMLNNY